MKRTVWVLTLLLSICACAAGQNTRGPEHPILFVTGPAGIVLPGGLATYSATISKASGGTSLTYIWTVVGGTIEKGQGTPTIQVRISDDGMCPTATVKVIGLSSQGPMTASETAGCEVGPSPEKLDQFRWPLSQTDNERLRTIADKAINNPNHQLYVFTPPDTAVISALSQRLTGMTNSGRLDVRSITFVENASKNSLIQIWLVPPGAAPPKCEGCEPPAAPTATAPAPANCPTLEVTGPSGVTARGTIMPFVVLVSEPRLKNLSFSWTVSTGSIAEGQGTRVMKVRAPAVNGTKNIVATVTVQGLPQGCRNIASGTAEIAFTGGSISRDIYAFAQ